MSLEKLEKKVEEKVKLNETETVDFLTSVMKVDNRDTDKIIAEIQRNYRLINNTTTRLERKLDIVIKAIESSGVDLEKLQKQEEIKRLEQKLKELKKEV